MGKEIIVASVRPLYRGEMPLADYLTYVEGYLDEAGAAGAERSRLICHATLF